MNYVIIIRGPLGVGKTTLAKALAQRLDAKHISIDKVLQENNLDNVDGECIPLRNFVKASELVLSEAREFLLAGNIVIFDGNFYHKGQIKHLKESLPFEHFIFSLKAPLEVCIERDHHRPGRHGKEAAEAVFSLVSRFEHGMIIDATKEIDEIIKEIISRLP